MFDTLTLNDFQNVCRFCVQTQDELQMIFELGLKSSGLSSEISTIIDICTGLRTNANDGLPQKICKECLHQLQSAYKFRQKCIESVYHLQNILTLSIKQEEDTNIVQEINNRLHTIIEKCNVKEETSVLNPLIVHETLISDINALTVDTTTTTVIAEPLPVICQKDNNSKPKKRIQKLSDKNSNIKKVQKINSTDPKREKSKMKKMEVCELCGFETASLKLHMFKHTQERKFECDICGRKFSIKQPLKHHLFSHLNLRNWKCKQCPRTFIELTKLNRHMRLHHSDKRDYVCDVCGKGYLQQNLLNRHKKTHSGHDSFQCSYCPKVFKLQSTLVNHVGVHTGVCRYKCLFCPKAFITTGAASQHRKKHKVDNEYQCRFCKTLYKEVYMLKNHMRDKHNNAPFADF